MKVTVSNFESYLESHERIFGSSKRIIDKIEKKEIMKKKSKKNKKILCPHCATVNLIEQDEWNKKCRKCGWEG